MEAEYYREACKRSYNKLEYIPIVEFNDTSIEVASIDIVTTHGASETNSIFDIADDSTKKKASYYI